MSTIGIDELIKENKKRKKQMFDGYDPITGDFCYGERKLVSIPDFMQFVLLHEEFFKKCTDIKVVFE